MTTLGSLLAIVPGDDLTYTATITNAATGDAVDLTGATLWWTLKERASDADDDAIAKLYWVSGGSSSGIVVATPSSGIAIVTMADTATASVRQRSHVWDMQMKPSSGLIVTVDYGTAIVLPRATQRITTP